MDELYVYPSVLKIKRSDCVRSNFRGITCVRPHPLQSIGVLLGAQPCGRSGQQCAPGCAAMRQQWYVPGASALQCRHWADRDLFGDRHHDPEDTQVCKGALHACTHGQVQRADKYL
eukprot:1147355-Pelagomonas_calceolata.AAC.8